MKLTTNNRFEFIKANRLCINCFAENHRLTNCNSSNCRVCGLKHHTFLHFENRHRVENKMVAPTISANNIIEKETQIETASASTLHAISPSQIFLSTVSVLLTDDNGKSFTCRALLDSGSQTNFVTKRMAGFLDCKVKNISIPVVGINNTTRIIEKSLNLTIASRFNNFKFNTDFLVVDKISEKLPSYTLPKKEFQIPRNLPLADPQFNVSGHVDLLIGAEYFYDIILENKLKFDNAPTLQSSQFGWIVSGSLSLIDNNVDELVCHTATLDLQIKKFSEIEDIADNEKQSNADTFCETHFVDTHRRTDEGRFIVQLPFKEPAEMLGESKLQALIRLKAMEKKFARDEGLRKEYTKFLKEYHELGHMETLNNKESSLSKINYLPHHAVLKENSLTTKLRVVFDASCKTTSKKSLNDLLYVGPTIQEDVFALILRFRTYKYVLTADIAKMYRQILIDPTQRHLQCIMWRNSVDDQAKTYKLNTFTYGMNSSSFLATRCLKQLELEEKVRTVGSRVVEQDFYMDDLITGANTMEEALQIRNEVIAILKKGCFQLRKWATNEPRLLDDLIDNDEENNVIKFDESDSLKTLGVTWHPVRDLFRVSVNVQFANRSVTKRNILAAIASIFDPLGLISPVIIRGKMLMQELWKLSID